jgi:hypothetical protein
MTRYLDFGVIFRGILTVAIMTNAAPVMCGDRLGQIDVLGEFARTAAPGWKKSALDFERDRDLPRFRGRLQLTP